MSSAGTAAAPGPELGQFLQVWSKCISEVLAQIAGKPFAIEVKDPPAEAGAADGDLQATIIVQGKLSGEMAMRVPRYSLLGVAQLFLGDAQDAAVALTSDHREAVEELLRQIAGHVTTAMKPAWGEVQIRLDFARAASWPPAADGWLASAAEAPAELWLEWQASAALLTSLQEASQPAEAAVPVASVPLPELVMGRDHNLDLLADVELEVTLCFGGRRMLLHEILQLGSGSVVELDRQVQEPADLLLDGKLIARGEVVVVDGNYGLRVLEVLRRDATGAEAGAGP